MKKKKYEDLTFTDDFIFCKVMTTRPDICKAILGLILGVKIDRIEYVESQKSEQIEYDLRGVRFDVYLDDENHTVYDIEMQTTRQKDLAKRMRYYQGMIDLNLIEKGAYYSELRKSYIIFICLDDQFRKNRAIYRFRNICVDDPSIEMGDDTEKVVLNAKGSRQGLSDGVKEFLDFLLTGRPTNKLTTSIDSAVMDAVNNKKWRTEFMTLEMKMKEREMAGEARGKKEGEQTGNLQMLYKIAQKGNTPMTEILDLAKPYGISTEKEFRDRAYLAGYTVPESK